MYIASALSFPNTLSSFPRRLSPEKNIPGKELKLLMAESVEDSWRKAAAAPAVRHFRGAFRQIEREHDRSPRQQRVSLGVIPRKKGATKALTLPGGITNSAVSDELAANGVTVEEVIDLIVKRIVKYYEKLEKDVFCKIRYRVSRLIGEQSPVGIALNFADAHACFGMREPEKKKTAAASKSTRQQ
ncbi:hypothetical protein CSKR_200026 [Clonorchis sinensis]|uniref:Uncharacterized protein n=1 Tax=Clonorchis sinensis TaxID=79923 RepID=A0A8T1LYQ7_CLOSI|nr:hypothetical protein CSKR_200026 [Clonorchis sinensis]